MIFFLGFIFCQMSTLNSSLRSQVGIHAGGMQTVQMLQHQPGQGRGQGFVDTSQFKLKIL